MMGLRRSALIGTRKTATTMPRPISVAEVFGGLEADI
jgi:hypothetical protein